MGSATTNPPKHVIDPDNDTGEATICNTLRTLYRRARETGDLESMDLIATAFDMAKRMDAKLRAYRAGAH
jgi:hypothetical protein